MDSSSRLRVEDFPFLSPTHFSFDCVRPECGEKFELTNDLYDHIREHGKGLECTLCKRRYKCMASLVYHVRTHTAEVMISYPFDDAH